MRRAWALAMMGRARGPIVAYGSPEWHALPDGPERVASVIKAAESYVIECQLFDERLAAEQKSAEDRAFVASLMGRVVEPGKFANWIAPPVIGINRQPVDFEYVRFN